jgi:hypothetical protein
VDVNDCRRRALALAEGLTNGAGDDAASCLRGLAAVAEPLILLIEDLKKTAAPESERRPLEQLLEEMRSLLSRKQPDDFEVRGLWRRAVEVLRAFAGVPPGDTAAAASPPPARRESFWK